MSQDELNRELRAVREIMVEAIHNRDLDELLRHVEPHIIFTPLNNETSHGSDQVRAYFVKQTSGPGHIVDDIHLEMKADDERIFFDDATAIIAGNSLGVYKLTNGLNFKVDWRWTAAMSRRSGSWKVAAFHSSANLFSNPLLSRIKQMALWGCVGALLAGLVAGALAGHFM